MKYQDSTIYLVGHAKVSDDNPIKQNCDIIFFPFVVDAMTHRIIDVSCNAVLDITRDFVRTLLVGCDLLDGVDEITETVRRRYFGSSQKAIIAAVKDAHGRLRDVLPTYHRKQVDPAQK